jgi:hypothetical protein
VYVLSYLVWVYATNRDLKHMGSLSGTKAPARRPLPSSVESSGSISKRLNEFWDNTLVPLFVTLSATAPAAPSDDEPTPTTSSPYLADPEPPAEQAVLLVSHGATISKLIRDVLLVEHGYTSTCNLSCHGIYNTSISIVRLVAEIRDEAAATTPPASILGELVVFASISHLVKKKDVVVDNADMLEQRSS